MEKGQKSSKFNIKSERRVIFNSRTFNSKLFLKLTGYFIHPSIVCVQTLKYERENRKLGEIEMALPWLKTFHDLMGFINLEETPESSKKLLIELTWSLFYKYYKKNIIFKKAAEKGEFFNILLKGKMLKLNMVFKRENLTVEEYLIYLFKMKLTKENEILKRCRQLNSFYADIDGLNLMKFCKDNPQFNYKELKEIAKNEIIELGFKLEDFQDNKSHKCIYSIDKYLKIAEVKKDTKNINNILATPKFYIGSYQKAGFITKGMAIGNLTNEISIDDSTYITVDNSDILYLNKKDPKIGTLYEMIKEKKKRILSKMKNNFYIFRKITDNYFINELIPFFQYKLFHKGDKIFLQDSLYEGIYLLKSGKIGLHFNSSLMEISTYISNIKNSLKDFKLFSSNLKMFKDQNLAETESLKSTIDKKSIPEKSNLYAINRYDISNIQESSIFGTNELYNYKTGLYYFTAECLTKEAIVYFLPKKHFEILLRKEYPVYLAVAEMVESKAKFIVEKMRLIIRHYEINRFKMKNNSENKEENKMKTFTIFNNYRNSINNLRRNNNNYPELKLYSKMNEKTYEFPIILKDKYSPKKKYLFTEPKKLNEEDNDNNNYTLKKQSIINNYKNNVTKTLENIYSSNNPGYFLNNKKRRNKTFKEKLFTNNTKIKFNNNLKLKLPSNFPYNVQNEFPTIVKSKIKNYNIQRIYINKKILDK